MKNLKLLIHDWDDTITNSFQTYLTWYADFGRHFNIYDAPDLLSVRTRWGESIPSLVNAAFPSISVADADSMVIEFRNSSAFDAVLYTPTIFSDVKSTFEFLRSKNIELGILTHAPTDSLHRSYKKNLGNPYEFHSIVNTYEDLPQPKPHASSFSNIISYICDSNMDTSQTLYIGDSVIDYRAAQAAGIPFIAVVTGITSTEDFLDAGLHSASILESFGDLCHIL